MIPGVLELELFNKDTGIIVAEAAIDQDNLKVILRDEPKDTIPFGGVISILQLTEFAAATVSDPAVVALIFAGERAGNGKYENLTRDDSIPNHNAAFQTAISKLSVDAVFAGSHTFDTRNKTFKVGQLQLFHDFKLDIMYIAIIQQVAKKVEASNGNKSIITSSITAELYRVNLEETLALLYARVFRPLPKLKVQLEE